MTQNKKVSYRDVGFIPYDEATVLQEKLMQKIVDIKLYNRNHPEEEKITPNRLLLVEHPHVYTLGKSGHEENMLANADKLREIGATFYKTNRGGDITYHGPGQIVGYPILDLENFKADIRWYMRSLEEVIIQSLKTFDIFGERSEGETGVWLDVGTPYARKICAMGVKSSRWATMHGFALNVNPDLRYFEYIIPCGIKDKAVTSIKRELEREVTPQETTQLKLSIKNNFAEIFGAEFVS